jgi:hypothetical protein
MDVHIKQCHTHSTTAEKLNWLTSGSNAAGTADRQSSFTFSVSKYRLGIPWTTSRPELGKRDRQMSQLYRHRLPGTMSDQISSPSGFSGGYPQDGPTYNVLARGHSASEAAPSARSLNRNRVTTIRFVEQFERIGLPAVLVVLAILWHAFDLLKCETRHHRSNSTVARDLDLDLV